MKHVKFIVIDLYFSPNITQSRGNNGCIIDDNWLIQKFISITPLCIASEGLSFYHYFCKRECSRTLVYKSRPNSYHHRLHDIHFVLDGEVDKVGVDEDMKGWAEGGVILEEERGRDRRSFRRLHLVRIFRLLLLRGRAVFGLQPRVAGADHSLHGGKLFRSFCSRHFSPEKKNNFRLYMTFRSPKLSDNAGNS